MFPGAIGKRAIAAGDQAIHKRASTMKHSVDLQAAAWQFVILWNKEHRRKPYFVDLESPDLLSRVSKCDGNFHIGHGLGVPCQVKRRNNGKTICER